MATTLNPYLTRVKLLQGATLADLETGEYVTGVDVDVTTVRDAPKPTSLFTAIVAIVGSTTTE